MSKEDVSRPFSPQGLSSLMNTCDHLALIILITTAAFFTLRRRRRRQWQRRNPELAVAKSIDSDQASDQAPDPKLAQTPSAPATQSDKDSDSDPQHSGVHSMKLQVSRAVHNLALGRYCSFQEASGATAHVT